MKWKLETWFVALEIYNKSIGRTWTCHQLLITPERDPQTLINVPSFIVILASQCIWTGHFVLWWIRCLLLWDKNRKVFAVLSESRVLRTGMSEYKRLVSVEEDGRLRKVQTFRAQSWSQGSLESKFTFHVQIQDNCMLEFPVVVGRFLPPLTRHQQIGQNHFLRRVFNRYESKAIVVRRKISANAANGKSLV